MTETFEQEVQQAPESQKVSWATKINYGIGITGRSVANGLTGRLTYYMLTIVRINRRHLAPLLLFGQAFDGISDLMMGTIIDNTRSRWGKFRPWIAIGTLTNALVTMGLFGMPASLAQYPSSWLTISYVAVMWLMWDLTYTLVDVAYWSMIPALSAPGKDRDIVSMIPRLASGVLGLATSFNMQIISVMGGGTFGEARGDHMFVGFRNFAIVFSIIYLITSLYGAATVKEPRIALPSEKKQSIGLAKALKILWNNKQTLTIVIVFILFNVAQNMTSGGSLFFFRHVSVYSDTENSIFNTAMAVAAGIGMFGFRLFVKYIGRSRFYKLSFFLPIIGCAGMFFFSTFMPGVFIPFLLSMIVGHIGYGIMGVMQNVMLADSVDYGEWQTGERNEGILFCTLTMLSKMAGLLNNAVQLGTFSAIRFGGDDHVPGVALTPFQQNGIKALTFGFSPVALIISFTTYMLFYKLTPERIEEINFDLIQRRREEALAKTTLD